MIITDCYLSFGPGLAQLLGRTSPLTVKGVRKESPYTGSNSAVESLTDFRCDATLSVMRQPT